MLTPGRNDPCPCGSGQKYKKCCLPKAEAARAAQRPRVTPRETAMPKILRFADSPQFDRDHDIADVMFWAGFLDDMDDDEADKLLESDDASAKYYAWFIWDLDVDEGRTVADLFVEQRGRSLGPDERAFIDRMRASCLGLYQVDGIEPGVGVTLRDLLSKETVFVHEKLGSEQLVRSDLVGARVVPNENGRLMFEGGLYLYDVADKHVLVAELKRYRRNHRSRFPGAEDRAFLKRHGMVFNHWWLDRVILRPFPKITTADGDEVMLARSAFDVAEPSALRAALEASPDVEAGDDGEYTWGEEASDSRRILATLRLEGERLHVETMSRDRDERCRGWLTSIAPGLTFRATSLETVEAAIERSKGAPPDPGKVPAEVEARIEGQMLDDHYRRWLDEPVPALDGVTPRQAAASRPLRPRLVDLLREFDNHVERRRRAGGHPYDTSWLWDALGLVKPSPVRQT
jgi:hypothetical protein